MHGFVSVKFGESSWSLLRRRHVRALLPPAPPAHGWAEPSTHVGSPHGSISSTPHGPDRDRQKRERHQEDGCRSGPGSELFHATLMALHLLAKPILHRTENFLKVACAISGRTMGRPSSPAGQGWIATTIDQAEMATLEASQARLPVDAAPD